MTDAHVPGEIAAAAAAAAYRQPVGIELLDTQAFNFDNCHR